MDTKQGNVKRSRRNTDRRKKGGDDPTRAVRERRAGQRRNAERRAEPRMAMNLWVEQELGNEVCFRRMGNLSSRGVFLEHGFSYPLGTKVRLRFRLPEEDADLELAAEVVKAVWANEIPGTSLRFTDLDDATRARLAAYVEPTVKVSR